MIFLDIFNPSFESWDSILRIFGRVGFTLVLLAIYKFYVTFASPLVKSRHRQFVVLFTISLIISFILLVINYIYPADAISIASLVFNSITTFILAFYLYRQANILEHYKGSEEFKILTKSMDSLIAVLKYR